MTPTMKVYLTNLKQELKGLQDTLTGDMPKAERLSTVGKIDALYIEIDTLEGRY